MSQYSGTSKGKLFIGWIWHVPKEYIVGLLEEFGLDPSGTLEKLRVRLWIFLSENGHDENVIKRLRELDARESPEDDESQDCETSVETVIPVALPSFRQDHWPGRAELIDQVPKLGPTYTGTNEPLDFVEHVEKLAETYGFQLDLVVEVLPELLTGEVLMWYLHEGKFTTWRDFKKKLLTLFMPPGFVKSLEEKIRLRKQTRDERFSDYVIAIKDMMKFTTWSEEEKFDLLYENSLTGLRLYVKKHEVHSTAELIRFAGDWERIQDEILMAQTSQEAVHQALPSPPNKHISFGQVTNVKPSNINERTKLTSAFLTNMWQTGGRNTGLLSNGKRRLSLDSAGQPERQKNRPEPKLIKRFMLTDGRCIQAKVELDGHVMTAVIDSGATRSFIRESVAPKIRTEKNSEVTRVVVHLADRSPTTVVEALNVKVRMGDRATTLKIFVITDAIDDVILGMDFLSAVQAKLRIGDEIIKITPSRAYGKEDGEIAPLSEARTNDKPADVLEVRAEEAENLIKNHPTAQPMASESTTGERESRCAEIQFEALPKQVQTYFQKKLKRRETTRPRAAKVHDGWRYRLNTLADGRVKYTRSELKGCREPSQGTPVATT